MGSIDWLCSMAIINGTAVNMEVTYWLHLLSVPRSDFWALHGYTNSHCTVHKCSHFFHILPKTCWFFFLLLIVAGPNEVKWHLLSFAFLLPWWLMMLLVIRKSSSKTVLFRSGHFQISSWWFRDFCYWVVWVLIYSRWYTLSPALVADVTGPFY